MRVVGTLQMTRDATIDIYNVILAINMDTEAHTVQQNLLLANRSNNKCNKIHHVVAIVTIVESMETK